ncbi:MAG: metallophosphoesterase [Rhodobacterales bacterium]|nr:metallophosphoesterase [Rhodobacterales bacterium]
MRIALISDIHANLVALDAVLADIRARNVDRIVCLGDIVDLGPEPVATLHRIRDLGCDYVTGNHDPLIGPPPGPPNVVAMTRWVTDLLSADDLAFLRGGSPQITIDMNGRKLLCVHGSPLSFDHNLLSTTPDVVLDRWLAGTDFDTLVAGHTHVQMLRRRGAQTLVNVGSVGAPYMECFQGPPPRMLPWAEYATVETRDGMLESHLHRVSYDIDLMKRRTLASGLPDAKSWLNLFLW